MNLRKFEWSKPEPFCVYLCVGPKHLTMRAQLRIEEEEEEEEEVLISLVTELKLPCEIL